MRLSPFSLEADNQVDRAGKLLVIQVHDGKFGSSPTYIRVLWEDRGWIWSSMGVGRC